MAGEQPNMEELVRVMARAIVESPDDVEVESFEEDGVMVMELAVAREDVGKVIGRQGRTVRSMRVILEAASGDMDLPHELDIVEDEDEEDGDDDAGDTDAEDETGSEG